MRLITCLQRHLRLWQLVMHQVLVYRNHYTGPIGSCDKAPRKPLICHEINGNTHAAWVFDREAMTRKLVD